MFSVIWITLKVTAILASWQLSLFSLKFLKIQKSLKITWKSILHLSSLLFVTQIFFHFFWG